MTEEKNATLTFGDKVLELPVLMGTENEKAMDISKLRSSTGLITLDQGFGNTGSCQSKITFIDGENGILRYRGYPIEDLAEKCSFVEVSLLLLLGELPDKLAIEAFEEKLFQAMRVGDNDRFKNFFNSYSDNIHPMELLSSVLSAVPGFFPDINSDALKDSPVDYLAFSMAKSAAVGAWIFRKLKKLPLTQPEQGRDFIENFLTMFYSGSPNEGYLQNALIKKAINLFLILHADHEQNCSTSTVRTVGSAKAGLFSSLASGVAALSGPLHGGANSAVVAMLREIHESGKGIDHFIAQAKDKHSGFRLMGFGHRVYKNFDPRSKIIRDNVDQVLKSLNISNPYLDLAKELRDKALGDSYFKQRKLYPNVDFFSGILLEALGVPCDLFTVLFAIGRVPGWVAHWKEGNEDPNQKIVRPRQVYTGNALRKLT